MNFSGDDFCKAQCQNKDQDALFPQGTVDQGCVDACHGMFHKAPPNPGVRPSGNNRAFILLEPMNWEIGSTGVVITVPAGFVTDYASIPSSLWSLYSPHDQYSRASIVHDYLYWSQLCTREQSDNLFMIAMKESEVPTKTRVIVYKGVTTFGESSWKENLRQRQAGMPRIVPVDRKDFPPNWSWEMYRRRLVDQKVKDPAFSGNSYCALGNTTDVPEGLQRKKTASVSNPAPKGVIRALNGMEYGAFLNGP